MKIKMVSNKIKQALKIVHNNELLLVYNLEYQLLWSSNIEKLDEFIILDKEQNKVATSNLHKYYCNLNYILTLKVFKEYNSYALIRYHFYKQSLNLEPYFLCRIIPYTSNEQHEIAYHAYLNKMNYNKKHNSINLTPRESEVLYFAMKNFTANEIALKLSNIDKNSVSPNTIGNILRHIMTKFDSFNSNDMLIKAYINNYNRLIPKKLLNYEF